MGKAVGRNGLFRTYGARGGGVSRNKRTDASPGTGPQGHYPPTLRKA